MISITAFIYRVTKRTNLYLSEYRVLVVDRELRVGISRRRVRAVNVAQRARGRELRIVANDHELDGNAFVQVQVASRRKQIAAINVYCRALVLY